MYFSLQIPFEKTNSQFIDAFDVVPIDTTILDLSENCLNNRDVNTLISAFKKIPAGVTIVDLSCAFIFTANSKCPLIWLASVIKPLKNITGLKLRNTSFENMSPVIIKLFFLELPNTLTTLDLSNSSFYKNCDDRTEADAFSIIFRGISKNITSINLRNIKSSIKLVDMLACLPTHVRTVTVAWSDIKNLSKNELIALGAAMLNVIKFEVVDKHNRPVVHEKVDIVRLNSGQNIISAYKLVMRGNVLSLDVVYETLAVQTKANAPMIKEFIKSRQALEQAELVKKAIKPPVPKEKLSCETVALLTTLVSSSLILIRLSLSAIYPSALCAEVTGYGKEGASLAKFGLFEASAKMPMAATEKASSFGPG